MVKVLKIHMSSERSISKFLHKINMTNIRFVGEKFSLNKKS